MAEHKNQQIDVIRAFVIGGVLGALAGIFFAPKCGKELRSDIKKKGTGFIEDARGIAADASEKAKEIIAEAKHQAEELKKEADRYLSEARQKAKEIVACIEKKKGQAAEPGKGITAEKIL